jgi:hypothetical protein
MQYLHGGQRDPRAEPFEKDEGAGDEPVHSASEGAQALGERGEAPEEIAGVNAEGSEDSLLSETANVGGAVFDGPTMVLPPASHRSTQPQPGACLWGEAWVAAK